MGETGISGDQQLVYQLLADRFRRRNEHSRIDDGLWLKDWRGLGIKSGPVFVVPGGGRSDAWIARVDLTFIYNNDVPDTAIASRAVGAGSTYNSAIESAIEGWMLGTASALMAHV